MNKRNLLLALCFLFLLCSCELIDYRKTEQVETPTNNTPPLTGEWRVEDIILDPHAYRPEVRMNHFMDKRAFFSQEIVAFFEDYALNPGFRMRKVELNAYLSHFYNVQSEEIGLENREVTIVSVFGEDKLPYEVIKYGEEKLVLYHQNSFFFLTKVSDEVTKEKVDVYIQEKLEEPAMLTDSYSITPSSGLLLGVRVPKRTVDSVETYEYKSVWIAIEEKDTPSVLQMEDLILPRKRGFFWKVGVDRYEEDGILLHKLFAIRMGEKDGHSTVKRNYGNSEFDAILENKRLPSLPVVLPLIERVDYAGNDYIALERKNYVTGQSERRMVTVEKLGTEDYVSFRDLAKKSTGELITNSSLRQLEREGNFTISDYDYGLERWSGHWTFFGRAQLENSTKNYQDFYLNFFPPKEVVLYDEHKLSWSMLQSTFPDMTDAFSSPTDGVVVIRKGNALFVYPMDNRIIRDKILMKVELPENSEIVLSEWAIGRNTDLWTKFFLENGAKKMSY